MATQKDFKVKNGLIVGGGDVSVSQGSVSISDQISGDTGQISISNGQNGDSFTRIGITGSGTADSYIRTHSNLDFHIGQSATSTTPTVSINTSGNILQQSVDVGGVTPPQIYIGQLTNAYQGGIQSQVHLTFKTTNNAGSFYWYRQSSIPMQLVGNNLSVNLGDYQINGTTVIDSSRNLINVNSLAIGTASTTLDLDLRKSAGGSVISRVWNTNTAGTGSAIFRLANSGNNADGSQLQFTDNNYYVGTITADRTNGMRFRVANSSNPIDSSTIRLTINPSGNATFTGTISNSAFTIPNSIGSAGQVLKVPSSGTTLEWGNDTGLITSITNFADNRILTASGSTTINGETNLTFLDTSGYTDLKINGSTLGGSDPALILRDTASGSVVSTLILTQDVGTTKFISKTGTSNGAFQFIGDNGTSTTTYGGFDASGNFEIGTTNVITSARNLVNIGTISSGAITIANSTTAATLLTVGSTSQTNYTLQDFRTDTLSGTSAYLIAYGSGNAQDGNFAMKNTNPSKNIFFQVGSVQALTLTTSDATFSGNIDINSDAGQLQFGADNDMQIFHNGANGEINNATGNFTIDSAGDIILDADTDGRVFFFDGGAEYGNVGKSSNSLILKSAISDGDILFQGNDGGSTITALTLDMSDAGAATFNSTISSGAITADNGVLATDLWSSNSQPSSNNAIFSGYGIIGNRGTFYITNGGGVVQIGNGAAHNNNPTATFTTSSVNLGASRVLQMNGTTVINNSRNLVNIGSISANDLTTQNNVSLTSHGLVDLVTIGSGSRAGAIKINDVAGANYSITAGGYDLTFYKNVSGTSNSQVMQFVGDSASDSTPDVKITNNAIIGENITLEDATSGVQRSQENLVGVPLEDGLTYFAFNHNTSTHPSSESAFDTMERTEITSFKDIGTWDNSSAFSTSEGGSGTYYLAEFHGYLLISTAGDYRFALNSDDASDMYIDGIRVADDYGAHGATGFVNDSSPTSIYLTVGYHKLFARFEQVTGGHSIQLGWNGGSGTTFVAIPSANLYHNSSDLTKAYNGTTYTEGNLSLYGAINSTGTGRAIQVNGTTRINSVGDIIGTSYYIGGTNIIDTSRNLTNIGTISSGAITSTGAITSADFFKATGNNLKFSAGGNHIFNVDLNGKIYPQTHNAVDLGFSSSLAFRNLHLSGTISSGAITSSGQLTSNAGGVNVNGGTGNAYVLIGSDTGNWIWKNYRATHKLALEDSDGTGEVLNFDTSGNATFSGKVTINEGDVADQLVIYRTSPSANQVGMKFDVHGVHSRFFGVGTDGHPYWSTTADLTGAGNGVWHSGLSNFKVGTVSVLTSSRNLQNIGTISSGAITTSGNLNISKDNPVLILSDTTSTSNADQVAYISFQDNGTEEAWIGWGSSGNSNLTINNNIGSVILNGNGTTQINDNLDLNGNADISGSITHVNDITIPSSSGGDGFIKLGSYLHIYGRNKSNTSAITINTTYDGAELNTYTPIYSGAASAGQFIMKQESGGHGTVDVFVKAHGTNSASANISTFTQVAQFNDAGYFDASNGLYVNGTSVISSSRNLTNIGTISSGSVTATSNQYQLRLMRTDDTGDDWRFYSWTSGLNIFPSDETSTVWFGRDGHATDVSVYNGNLKIGTTTVIDSSRNLVNIGSISSGAITCGGIHTSAGLTFGQPDHFLGDEGGQNDSETLLLRNGASASGNSGIKILAGYNDGGDTSGKIQLYTNGSTTSPKLEIDIDGNIKMGSTTVITNGRNLTNIGTISSGAITTTGNLDIANKIRHIGDTDTYLSFANADDFRIVVGNSTRAAFNTSKIHFNQEGINQDFQVEGSTDSSLFYVDASADSIGIGDSSPPSNTKLAIQADGIGIRLDGTANTTRSIFFRNTTSSNPAEVYADGSLKIRTEDAGTSIQFQTNDTTALTLTSSQNATFNGNVETGNLTIASGSAITFEAVQSDVIKWDSTYLNIGAAEADDFKTRLRGFGGTTSIILDDGQIDLDGSKDGASSPIMTIENNSTTNKDGTLLDFRRAGGFLRGSIGTNETESNTNLYITGGSAGLKFLSYITYKAVVPTDGDGDHSDNLVDLGASNARFDDVYATNGTIQTSDRNEKQDIQELSDAEQRVATACKSLIRRYKFNSAVAEKGDDARYHFGIIAQDLQDAFTTEGLDASDYGMFISETWTDEEGNEQTRLGVRYNELLAFIIATL